MVINFNLLLVWLPMCKYSLTKLACTGSNSMKIYKLRHLELVTSMESYDEPQLMGINSYDMLGRLKRKFNLTIMKFKFRLIEAKINTIKSFLVAVDHCKYLHTICATTITLASGKYCIL